MVYLMLTGVMLLFFALGGLAALLRWQLLQMRKLRAELQQVRQEVQQQLDGQSGGQDALSERLDAVQLVQNEQATMQLVQMQVLIEKGMLEEAEIQEAHLRMIVEPARLQHEHDALLADLPDKEQLREQMLPMPLLPQ